MSAVAPGSGAATESMFSPDPKDPKEPGYWGLGPPIFNASWPYFVLVPLQG